MAFAGSVRSDSEISGINVTPLVDVMLVLLIIFMVTAPLLSRTLGLDLSAPPPVRPEAVTLQLQIGEDGALSLDQVPLAPWLLDAALQAAQRRDPSLSLQVSVAPEVRYQQVAEALAAARNAGIASIGFDDG